MGDPAIKHSPRFTWSEYQSWPDDERWELIGGEAYDMSPAPSPRHQVVAGNLFHDLRDQFRGKQCQPYIAPVDVKLSDLDVVQPDLLVVCDRQQVTRTHIEGVPTLVIEILSPTSQQHDRRKKTKLYERYGVAEYWIVTPHPALIEVYVLDGASYRVHGVFGKDDELTSPTFPELKIALAEIFDFPLEPDEQPRQAKEPPAPAYRTKTT